MKSGYAAISVLQIRQALRFRLDVINMPFHKFIRIYGFNM